APLGQQTRLRLALRGNRARDGGGNRRRGTWRALRIIRLEVRDPGPAQAYRTSRSGVWSWTAHDKRARLEPTVGSQIASNPPHPVSDNDFLKIIAILRMAVPYTGIIMST